MKSFLYPLKETWDDLCKRPVIDMSSLDTAVRSIIEQVRQEGDRAVRDCTLKFDKVTVDDLRVSASETEEAASSVPGDLKKAINVALENIEKYHRSQLTKEKPVETALGVRCWRENIPIEKVGLYIPAGSAPLFSTVLMLAIPARIAGCGKIILCTPPGRDGRIDPLILYTAGVSGIKDIFRAGGAQAIAAMAFGTESIPKADKIFGPGNQYVTKAKEIVQSMGVAIDLPAGPSEVLVIADSSADPAFIAADLLSQAEHGPDSQVIFLTNSKDMLMRVKNETDIQLQALPRKDIAAQAINNSISVLFDNLNECIDFSNAYAPEHLIINTANPSTLAGRVKNAGSVFIGKFSCESAGDYASGTNHTLPTNGMAKSFSGVSVDSFMKKITFQEISREGLENIGPAIALMAQAEGLEGHSNAVNIRLKTKENG